MKNKFLSVLAGALLAPVALIGASFEGTVTMKITEGRSKPVESTFSIKGEKTRIDSPAQKDAGGMVMDAKKREMMFIMTDQRMYMTMALPDPAAEVAKRGDDAAKFEKSGETEKIAGYTATKYILTEKDGTMSEVWLAEGLGTFMGMGGGNPMAGGRGKNSSASGWERALAGKELFPLRTVSKDKAGKEKYRMEVTAIEKKKLPDELFTPPADFKKLDMGAGMGGMMKGILQGFGR